jgi:nitronate monooxygenase
MGSIWAGTGVGLIKKQEKAGEIIHAVRFDARKYLERALLCL